MPKRDRGFGFWVATAFFIAALLSLILALTYDVATSHTERKLRAEQNSSGYAFSAEKRMKEACGGLSGEDLIACVQKEVEATNEHKRSEHDLTAQEDMDDWSFWLLWVSVSSVAVSTLAVILVWRTLDVTRETLIATQDMARDTREIGEAQTRPYLGFDVEAGDVRAGKPLMFHVKITNHGSSPAFEVAVASTAVIRRSDWIWGDDGSLATEERPSTYLHPKGSFTVFVDSDPPSPLTEKHIRALRSGDSAVFARVTVYFKDVFAKPGDGPRIAEFRFEFSGDECFSSGKARIAGKGNYST